MACLEFGSEVVIVRVEPPVRSPTREYPNRELGVLALAARTMGQRVYPPTVLPMDVHVLEIIGGIDLSLESRKADDFRRLAWGEIYQSALDFRRPRR